eukprot:gene18261-37109_t
MFSLAPNDTRGDPMTTATAPECITVRTEGRVGIVTLNRPKQLNALNNQLMDELGAALKAFDADDDIGCMILTGSEKAFVDRMNARAQQLGMRDTSFANATGLKNPGNRTTARDMARLSLALIRRFPGNYAYFSTRKVTWQTRVM